MNMIIVSGASGVGKGTLVRLFIDSDPEEYELVRSVTTRKPRLAGDYYTFVSKEEFRSMSNEGAFLETNLYQGSKEFYGTPKAEVERIIRTGKIPVLGIDVNGKQQIERIAEQYGFVIRSVFITAPPDTVYSRLIKRGEPLSNIIDRLTASYDEVAAASAYDSFIVNRSLEVALNDLKAVVKGSDSGCSPGVMKYQSELMTLLRSIQEGVDEISE